MKPPESRLIELESPLEVDPFQDPFNPYTPRYRVYAVRVEATGEVDAVARGRGGRPIANRRLRRRLAREALRVLGKSAEVAQRPRYRSRPPVEMAGLIPNVWGLRFRGV